MVSFVHIADKNDEVSIVKNGIRSVKRKTGPRGGYAVPVVPNYATTHQWARELKRRGIKTLLCVQFRIPGEEVVLVGKIQRREVADDRVRSGCGIPNARRPDGTRSRQSRGRSSPGKSHARTSLHG